MILNRIKPITEVYQRRNQNEFRGEKSKMSQILVLQRVIRGIKENNYLIVITFIDSKESFDSIYQGKMIRILKAYAIPQRLVNAISGMYSRTIVLPRTVIRPTLISHLEFYRKTHPYTTSL